MRSMPEPIRVLVVDDQETFRRGLEAEDGIAVVGSTTDGAAALTLAAKNRPDVVLMDLDMPYGGVRAAGAIKRAVPGSRIVILTAPDDEARVFDAIKAGAVGGLPNSSPAVDAVAAIRSVHKGMCLIGSGVASRLMTEFASMAGGAHGQMPAPRLTSRELEVLKLMVGEHANHEIARLLFISENTVKNHVRNVLDKLQLYARWRDLT